MHYLGGKFRIAKQLSSFLESKREPNQPFVEPFCGACNITAEIQNPRFAYDAHPQLIFLWKALLDGWIPPDTITEERYQEAKQGKYSPHLTAFIGFGCSFSGKYFGGFARDNRGRSYARDAKNSLLRKVRRLKGVQFECRDYLELNPKGSLIYCDPPYSSSTDYTISFSHEEFWEKCREWTKDNLVLVSEYTAPEDFVEIWSIKTKTELRTKENGREDRIERLFCHISQENALTNMPFRLY